MRKHKSMKNIHIKNSYNIWNTSYMKTIIDRKCYEQYGSDRSEEELNRNYCSMYIEWWLHNIGYYITKPFCFNDYIKKINARCKDVDINIWR